MHWQLWDTESGNLVACYATEQEALRGVRDVLAVNSPDFFDALSLGVMHDDGEVDDATLPPTLDGDRLRARLDQMADANEASAVSVAAFNELPVSRLAHWLGALGFAPEAVADPHTSMHYRLAVASGYSLHVLRSHQHADHSVIISRLDIDAYGEKLAALPERSRYFLLQGLRAEMLRSNVEFTGIDHRLDHIELSVRLYDDGLSQDAVYRRVTQMLDAVLLVVVLIQSALDAPAEVATPAEADHGQDAQSRELRLVTSSMVGRDAVSSLGRFRIGPSALSAS